MAEPRIYKFRAWDGESFHHNVTPMFSPQLAIIQSHPMAGLRLYDIEAIDQFTGATDREGVEIYENDIIHFKEKNQFYDGLVCWSVGYYCYVIQVRKPWFHGYRLSEIDHSKMEIIDNLHNHKIN
jgi:hypothetical protein